MSMSRWWGKRAALLGDVPSTQVYTHCAAPLSYNAFLHPSVYRLYTEKIKQ